MPQLLTLKHRGVIRTIYAYLVEGRSIGGLSGSPAFANMLGFRQGELVLQHPTQFRLLGLVNGHYDEVSEKMNMGITVVTPVKDIFDVIQGSMKKAEEEKAKADAEKNPATADDAFGRFNKLLSKVTSVPKDALQRALDHEKAQKNRDKDS